MSARAPTVGRAAGRVPITLKAVLAMLVLATAAGCVDFDLAVDTVFPPGIPGLPEGGSWVSLPVRSWVVEGDVKARAIAACFPRNCAPAAAVGLFTATGPAADRLADLVAHPGEIRLGPDPHRRGLASTTRSRPPATRAQVEPVRIAEMRGATIRIARRDGTHPAYGIVLGRRRAGTETVLIVISPHADVARRLAQDVASRLE